MAFAYFMMEKKTLGVHFYKNKNFNIVCVKYYFTHLFDCQCVKRSPYKPVEKVND